MPITNNLQSCCCFRVYLVFGGLVVIGTSVKVTEEEMGNSCISDGSTHKETLPPLHSSVQVVVL